LFLYVLDYFQKNNHSQTAMPNRKPTVRRKRAVKRLLDEVAPNKSTESKLVVIDLVSDSSQKQTPSSASVTDSSSMLKRHEEEVKKGGGGNSAGTVSPDPSLLGPQPALQQLQGQQLLEVRRRSFASDTYILIRSSNCCCYLRFLLNQSVRIVHFSIRQCTDDTLV
jgi:hypothetical protein